MHAQFSVNQSRPEDITMREDLSSIAFVGDDGFGECQGPVSVFTVAIAGVEINRKYSLNAS